MERATLIGIILTALMGLVTYLSRHWITTTEKAVEVSDKRIDNLKDVVVECINHIKYIEHQHENQHHEKPFDTWNEKIN